MSTLRSWRLTTATMSTRSARTEARKNFTRTHSQTAETQNQAIKKWTGGIKTDRQIWATHGEYVLPEIF